MIRGLFLENLSLWSCVWQSTLLMVIGLAGSSLLRHRPARAFQVLLLAMIAAVVVPAMSLLVKHFELGAFVAEPIGLQVETMDLYSATLSEAPAIPTEPQTHGEAKKAAIGVALAEGSSGSIRIPWHMMFLFGWMIVTLALLGRLLLAFITGMRLIRRSQPKVCEHIQQALDRARTRLGITKNLQIHTSREISSPMIWCWSRTTVLLVPRDLDNNVDWAGVICHELAHCMRRDHVSGLTAEMIACILCWNPLSWLARKRLIRLGEQACDDWVVAGGRPVENYARSLLNFKPQKQVAFVPAVVHSRKGVAARVQRILKDNCRNPRAGVKWVLAVTVLVACLSVGIAFAQTRPAKPATGTVESQGKATESLHKAVADGDIEQVKSLISRGAKVNAKDENGQTALNFAVINGHKVVVELLLTKEADIDARGRYDAAPLHAAAWFDRKDIAEVLLRKGADVNALQGESRWTPLHSAANRGNVEVAEVLIANGADLSAMSEWDSTPLYEAVWNSHNNMTRLLANKGADLNFTPEGEWPPLYYILSGKDKELVELLVSRGSRAPALHLAAFKGDLAKVKNICVEGTDVNSKDEINWTPLHWAASGGQRDTVEFLISNGADIKAESKFKVTPLHQAATKEVAELLLSKRASVNAKTEPGNTPLHRAVQGDRREVAELLVARGADVNAKNNRGRTPLYHAALAGHNDVIELLIDNGANVNAKDQNGHTALRVAIQREKKEVADLLIAKGADPGDIDISYVDKSKGYKFTPFWGACASGNVQRAEWLLSLGANIEARNGDGLTPLTMAACNGHAEVVQFLLDKGADIEARGYADNTPIQSVVSRGRMEIVELLLAHGAKINATPSKHFGTAALQAMRTNHSDMARWCIEKGVDMPDVHQAAYFGEADKVRSLLSEGADVNQKDIAGYTPLHCAVYGRNKEVVQLLLDNGADVKARGCSSDTPLFLACNRGYLDMVKHLLDSGADVNGCAISKLRWGPRLLDNWSNLHVAAHSGRTDVVEYLLGKGADIHAKCTRGDGDLTPLHMAARSGHVNVVEVLLAKGANANLKSKEGRNALDIAREGNHKDVVELLKEHGSKE